MCVGINIKNVWNMSYYIYTYVGTINKRVVAYES